MLGDRLAILESALNYEFLRYTHHKLFQEVEFPTLKGDILFCKVLTFLKKGLF